MLNAYMPYMCSVLLEYVLRFYRFYISTIYHPLNPCPTHTHNVETPQYPNYTIHEAISVHCFNRYIWLQPSKSDNKLQMGGQKQIQI